MDPNQTEDDLHLHQKPPPPYEEVQRESSSSASSQSSTSSSLEKKSESAIIQASPSKYYAQPHSLSIENPMAEVFANPEFDHVELKIQGHINPSTSVPTSSSSDSNSTHSVSRKFSIAPSLSSMASVAKEKSKQVFIQWKDWHRPDVIAIRLAFLLISLLVIVHMARMVFPPPPSLTTSNNVSNPSINKQLQYSARTGKAMTMPSDIDQISSNDALTPVAGEIKITHTKLEQPDLDVIGGEDLPIKDKHNDHQTLVNKNAHPLILHENEPSLIEQDLDHHDTEPSSTSVMAQSSTTTTRKSSTKISTTSTTTTTTTTTTPMPLSTVRTRLSSTVLMPSSTTTTTTMATPVKISTSTSNKTYNISIIIHSANVPDMDSGYLMGRASDTYCNVYIDDILVGKTPIIDNSNNPSWHYLLPRQFTVKKDTWIRIELMDSDHVRNDHIGGILLNFGDLINNGSLNKPINMFHGRGYIWVTISAQPGSV